MKEGIIEIIIDAHGGQLNYDQGETFIFDDIPNQKRWEGIILEVEKIHTKQRLKVKWLKELDWIKIEINCKDCKHWAISKEDKNIGFCWCSEVRNKAFTGIVNKALTVDPDKSMVRLTKADFGCKFWEEKK